MIMWILLLGSLLIGVLGSGRGWEGEGFERGSWDGRWGKERVGGEEKRKDIGQVRQGWISALLALTSSIALGVVAHIQCKESNSSNKSNSQPPGLSSKNVNTCEISFGHYLPRATAKGRAIALSLYHHIEQK
jgi:hypothetical protein